LLIPTLVLLFGADRRWCMCGRPLGCKREIE
jgi:hypothetical protein